jgi:hypothetical protein
VRSPGSEIITAIDTNATSFSLSLDLVLAEQVVLAILANSHASSMGINEISISVCPSASRNNILGLHNSSKQEVRESVLAKHDGEAISRAMENQNVLQVVLYKLPRT